MTTDTVVFDDIEAVMVTYLTSSLTGWTDGPVTIATNVPDPRPDRLIKVTRTGGTQRDRITDLPQVTFECWAPNEPEASRLARWVRAYVGATEASELHGVDGLVWIRAVTEVGGPAFTPDPETRLPRYQFTVQINLSSHRPAPTPDTEKLSFDWEFRALGRGTGVYVDLVVTGGVLPAGTYHWTQDYNVDGYATEGDYQVAADMTNGEVTDFGSIYLHPGDNGTVAITGPYGIAFTATGPAPEPMEPGDYAVIDSGTVTYTRPIQEAA